MGRAVSVESYGASVFVQPVREAKVLPLQLLANSLALECSYKATLYRASSAMTAMTVLRGHVRANVLRDEEFWAGAAVESLRMRRPTQLRVASSAAGGGGSKTGA
eukprot:3894394-Amphidinium_carterae.1